MDSFLHLPDIPEDVTNPQYENLQKDIAHINVEELNKYIEENKIDSFLERIEIKHLARCKL